MNRILAIFRKDARHLWPQAALLIVLMALSAAFDPTYSRVRVSYYEFFAILILPVACWLVIVSAIHEEKLPGDRQYWLTRPYSWKELLAAKLLYIAVFVNLPLLVCHVAIFLAVGLPLAEQWPALLWRQVFFTAFYILPAVALASITRTIGRMVAAGLLVIAGFVLFRGAFMVLVRRPMMIAGPSGDLTAILRAALLIAGVSAIVALQYARRRTALAAGLTAALATALLLPAFAGLATSSARTALSLELDPERRSAVIPDADQNLATLEFPVRLNPAPAGVLLDRARIAGIRIDDAVGRHKLLRVLDGQLHDLENGRGWLSVFTDSTLLLGAGGRQVVLSGVFGLRLFRTPRTLPAPHGHAVRVPAVGVCRDFIEEGGGIAFSCYSAMPHAAVLAKASGAGVNWILPPGSVSHSVPTDAGFQPLTRFVSLLSYANWQQAGAVRMVAAEPLPLARVDFRFGAPLPGR